MKAVKIFLIPGLFLIYSNKDIKAQEPMKSGLTLDSKQQNIITISASV